MNPETVVQALFDEGHCHDLILVVGDRSFRCHRFVLAPASRYLQQCLQWPSASGAEAAAVQSVQIDLPELVIPNALTLLGKSSVLGSTAVDRRPHFETYLKVVYGLHRLGAAQPAELFAVAQIADFMMSEAVAELCDAALSAIDFACAYVQVAVFCERYSLPKTLALLKGRIADDLPGCGSDSCLPQLGPPHFTDIVKSCRTSTRLHFWTITGYAAGQSMLKLQLGFGTFVTVLGARWGATRVHVRSDRRSLWEDLIEYESGRWDLATVSEIYDDLKTITIAYEEDDDASDRSMAFLLRIIAQAYRRLYVPAPAAAATLPSFSFRPA